jgi:hypothetical protein
MSTAPATDVERVLDRMGRSAFGYRSFRNPIEELPPMAPGAADPPATAEPAAGALFSLIDAALPGTTTATGTAKSAVTVPAPAAAPAPMAPMNPLSPRMPPPPAPQEASEAGPRTTPLRHVFRILSGHAGPAPAWRAAGGHEPAFPFRRR